MGSSKKHKKHKDRKHSYTSGPDEASNQSFTASTPAPEQRPLKLVLKVSGGTTGSPMMSPALVYPEYEAQDGSRLYESNYARSGEEGRSHSSEKKHKKKKSKKKHRKHSHHHHHHHHHRHRSSCSHHSKCSSSSPNAATSGELLDPITSTLSLPQSTTDVQMESPNAPIPKLQISNANSAAPTISSEATIEPTRAVQSMDQTTQLSPQPQQVSSLAAIQCNTPLSPSVPTLGETLKQIQPPISIAPTPTALVPSSSIDTSSTPTVVHATPVSVPNFLPVSMPTAPVPSFAPSASGIETTAPTSSSLLSTQPAFNNVSINTTPSVPSISFASSTAIVNQPLSTPLPQNTLPRAPIGLKPLSRSPLQSLLLHLVKQIEKRDPQEFFAWPVTDQIAPGYSSIITRPMDISTIRQKISTNSYPSVNQLKSDVRLMCDNAMTYNRPDTVYYKAARKLWHYARDKLFTRDALLELVKLYQGVTNYQLGLTCADYSDADQAQFGHLNNTGMASSVGITCASIPTNTALPVTTIPSNGFAGPQLIGPNGLPVPGVGAGDTFWNNTVKSPVETSAEQILAEATKAASAAAERLSLAKPNGSHFALVRQQSDGSTSLAIVGSTANESEKELNLQAVVGRVTDGTSSLPPFKESDLAVAKPIESIASSCFSSYLPNVSSAKASLSAEESNLLLSTYGQSELGLAYSHSLLQFAGESDYVMGMVDSLLDVLTAGAHSKLLQKLKDEEKAEEQMDTSVDKLTEDKNGNDEPVRTLDIEMEEIDKAISMDGPDVDSRLVETSNLLSQLEQVQKQRLSSGPLPTKPCKEELRIAQILSEKLAQLISTYTAPADITDIKAIRKAMGVQVKTELTSA